MLKTLERLKAAAEIDTRRRTPSKYLKEVESQLAKEALERLLALDLLRGCREPMCNMSRNMSETQSRVGKFVGQALTEARKEPPAIDLQGFLFGITQAIHLGQPFLRSKLPKFSMRDLTLRKVALSAVDFVLPDKSFVPDEDSSLSPAPLEFDDDTVDLVDDFSEINHPSETTKPRKAKSRRRKVEKKKKVRSRQKKN